MIHIPSLEGLPSEALQLLVREFDKLAQLEHRPTARWANWCWWCINWPLGLAPPGREPEHGGLAAMTDGELIVLRDHFGQSRWCCSPEPSLAAWCRAMVEAFVDELDRRMWARANEEARFQIIAAEENRRASEAKPPPDLRGLPTWKEISSPPGES